MTLKTVWVDTGREPTQKPNPDYPKGIDIDLTKVGEHGCFTKLKYPAKRCGYHYVECDVCGTNAAITTAGRKDDPRSVTMPCKENRR